MYLQKEIKLKNLFEAWAGEEIKNFERIAASGSNRQYFRIKGNNRGAVGVIGDDDKENIAFLTFTEHFYKTGLNVPEIYISDKKEGVYLLQDLEDVSLFSMLMDNRDSEIIPENIADLYRQSLEELIKFQTLSGQTLDYSVCYPRSAFDSQSMQWDLNYFKYYFLKLNNISFNEQRLEDDFQTLINYLEKADSDYFMYRDFQARNILIFNNKPWFIDYQGGRKGPLQYDVASLLFQAKAELPFEFRQQMLDYYIEKLGERIRINKPEFIRYYYGFVLIRTLQVLGAYGYRGYYEKKPHFIESINFALQNVKWLMLNVEFNIALPELFSCLKQITHTGSFLSEKKSSQVLTVEINSFSYKKSGIPKDKSEHGGGFVFDCRALPNPGRYDKYKQLTGRDRPVIDFLKKEPAVDKFLYNVYEIIGQAIDNYIDRGFDRLMVNFGCTGGQHRSVYSAENLYKRVKDKYDIKVELYHREL